ncbi:MAG TPA: hypothetical protein VK928_13940 [Longimicrobiales bacterium]|nr:hypothetical protein [Longimicrobiales bacterium]
MTASLHMILLMFATIGYAGTGASLAVARSRYLSDGQHDPGMLGVAAMLFVFGVLCTVVGSGVLGVLAFGGVTGWVGYVAAAQRLGLFRIETGMLEATCTPHEPRQRT